MERDLLRKKPVGRISSSSSSWVESSTEAGVGNRANRRGVTSLTRASVHCADRITATSSCQASS